MIKSAGKVGKAGRGMLARALSSASAALPPDEEQGQRPAAANEEGRRTRSSSNSTDRPLRIITTNEAGTLIPAEDKLLIFRNLTGIDTAPVVTRGGHSLRTAANIGIYTRVVRNERWSKKVARFVTILDNLCMALQIIMGAAVTAAAASRASYSNITSLGACATITASTVAYIRGSGQPDKLRHEESRWRWVREFIEQRERELCLADTSLDVYDEVRKVEDMFREVKEEIEGKEQGDPEGGRGTCDCPCKSGEDGQQTLPRVEEVVAQVLEPEAGTSAAREKAPE